MREIVSNCLFIGNARDGRSLRALHESQIEAVVDLAMEEPPAMLSRDLLYARIPILDGVGNSDAILKVAVSCVTQLIRGGFRTLVVCSAGMSRSPTVAAASIALAFGRDFDECLAEVTIDAPHDLSPALCGSVRRIYNQLRNEQ